jgi:hypothetical protein
MSSQFVKLTVKDNNHLGFIYKEGLNSNHFPAYFDKNCVGMYFQHNETWTKTIASSDGRFAYWIWDCEPIGEYSTHREKLLYSAPSIILTNPRCIWTDVNFQLKAIKACGLGIQFIDDQTEEIQIAAVMQNWKAIEHIANPSKAVQQALKVSKNTPIRFIKDPAEPIDFVKSAKTPINFIKDPVDKINFTKSTSIVCGGLKKPDEEIKNASKKIKLV